MHRQVLDLQAVKMGKRFCVFLTVLRYCNIASFIHPNSIQLFLKVPFSVPFGELHFIRNGQLFFVFVFWISLLIKNYFRSFPIIWTSFGSTDNKVYTSFSANFIPDPAAFLFPGLNSKSAYFFGR